MLAYLTTWATLRTDRRAVTMVEYGLMAALIAVVCITAVTTLGGNLNAVFADLGNKIGAAN